jgi:SAM-dependent methyltransferase
MLAANVLAFAHRSPHLKRFVWRAWYQFLARRYPDRRWTLMNYGYRPPETEAPLALAPEDEPDRSCIQLYRAVASAVDLAGREVLEVGSGRGGGASCVASYLRPRRVVGVDLSPRAVAFCRVGHARPGLSFETGNAKRLGFSSASFDAVLNVESLHCYGDLGAFFGEVRRVLRPGGHLIYADFRLRTGLDAWRAQLRGSGLQLVDERDLTPGVIAALDADDAWKRDLIQARIDRPLPATFGQFAGLRGSIVYDELRAGTVVYRAFVLQNRVAASAAGYCALPNRLTRPAPAPAPEGQLRGPSPAGEPEARPPPHAVWERAGVRGLAREPRVRTTAARRCRSRPCRRSECARRRRSLAEGLRVPEPCLARIETRCRIGQSERSRE